MKVVDNQQGIPASCHQCEQHENNAVKSLCVMPEMPYCPACRFGSVVLPEWAEIYEDATECEWVCSLRTQEQYDAYMKEAMNEMQ